ncbi:MAG: hypothetical protein PHE58_01655 [Candidatus Omnitrophica bacterium]|nr:hypothetical protein [Candidatus Omnitrophota bacterium]
MQLQVPARHSKKHSHAGQLLIFVLLTILVVGIVLVALAGMWQAQSNVFLSQKNALTAFYLAEAGLARGKVFAYNNVGTTGWQPCADDTNAGCWYTDISVGKYKFNVVDLGAKKLKLESKGRVVNGTVISQRELLVNINVDPPPGGPGTKTTDPWSWSEK